MSATNERLYQLIRAGISVTAGQYGRARAIWALNQAFDRLPEEHELPPLVPRHMAAHILAEGAAAGGVVQPPPAGRPATAESMLERQRDRENRDEELANILGPICEWHRDQ